MQSLQQLFTCVKNQYFQMENARKFHITRLAQHCRVNLKIDVQSFINISEAILKLFAYKQEVRPYKQTDKEFS